MDVPGATANSKTTRKKDAADVPVESTAQRLAELAALVDAVKERVRAQYPESTDAVSWGTICVGLPDLMPLSRARDAAAGKMAAIGSVNPRPGGLVNGVIQTFKKTVARSLNWFVRDQVVFNRQMITCVETCLETLAEVNRTIHNLAGQANTQVQAVRAEAEPLRAEARTLRAKTSDLADLSSHWYRWREQWQLKLHRNEVEFLKSVADLNTSVQEKIMYLEAAQQQRMSGIEESMRELHRGYDRRLGETQAAYEQRLKEVQSELGTALRQTSTELDASYRQTASQLERGFHESLTQTEAQFEGRTAQVERNAAESLRSNAESINKRLNQQARDFEQSVATSLTSLQKQFYDDLNRIRTEYEQIIHAELRVVRQRMSSMPTAPQAGMAAPAADGPAPLPFDYARFADRFRGPEQYVADSQRFYLPYFTGRRRVLDIGCGRGEFLKLMEDVGVPAKGIEASAESVAYCRTQGLDAEEADLFRYLADQPEAALDGIFCSQVVEHLPAERMPEMVRLCASRLATGGVLVMETPNPECLAIFATHFYLDPTHTRPVPSQLLAFYMEEFGMGRIEVQRRAPAVETMPEVGDLPQAFRERFFGGLDYAIIGYKL